MNFTAKLPSGITKDVWIAKLPKGTIFTTRRQIKCLHCNENSLRHTPEGYCMRAEGTTGRILHKWKPLPYNYKIGKKISICSGRGTKAICECGHLFKMHGDKKYGDDCTVGACPCKDYLPLKCELLSVMDEVDYQRSMPMLEAIADREKEAHKEGFETFQQLQDCIKEIYGGHPKTYRLEFRR